MLRALPTLIFVVASLLCAPATSAQQTISLEQAWSEAQQSGAAIRIAQARAESADARALVASQWWLPEVRLGAGYHALSGAEINAPGELITDASQRSVDLGAGLSATWTPAVSLGASAAANLEAVAATHDLASVRSSAHLSTAWAYYDLLEAEQTEQAMDRWILSNNTWSSELRALVGAGLAPEFSALLIESAGQSLLADQAAAAATRSAATARLQLQMGSTSEKIRCAETELLFEAISTGQTIERPESLAAQARLDAAQQLHKTALHQPFLPSIRVGAASGVFGTDLPDLYGRRGADASLSWRIPLDRIFGAGGAAKLRQSDALIAQQELAAISHRQVVQRNNAHNGLVAAISRYQAAHSAEKIAARALEQSTQRLALDIAEPQEVFIVRQAAIEAELDRISAAAAAYRAQLWLSYTNGLL